MRGDVYEKKNSFAPILIYPDAINTQVLNTHVNKSGFMSQSTIRRGKVSRNKK